MGRVAKHNNFGPSPASPFCAARPTPGVPVLSANILWLHDLRLTDLARVGGKNSSLGEMIGQLANLGVSVPGGFATTSEAFKDFIAHNDLHQRIFDRLATLDVEDVPALNAAGGEIRGWVIDAPLQPELDSDIRDGLSQAVRRQRRRRQSPSRCAPRRPPKTCPTPRSPASRKPSSTSPAKTTSCARSRKSSPASTTIAPSPTACTTASSTRTCSCPPACS